jgi:hypothetical protein
MKLNWSGRLAAVVAAIARGLPGDRGKGALEEGVVDDVALVIFSFDDPVAGVGFALPGVGEDEGGVEALCGVDEKWPAGAKGIHEAFSWRPYWPPKLFQHLIRKKDVIVFVDFHKGFLSLSLFAGIVVGYCDAESDLVAARLNLSGFLMERVGAVISEADLS